MSQPHLKTEVLIAPHDSEYLNEHQQVVWVLNVENVSDVVIHSYLPRLVEREYFYLRNLSDSWMEGLVMIYIRSQMRSRILHKSWSQGGCGTSATGICLTVSPVLLKLTGGSSQGVCLSDF
jgi:hypothetical protein